MRLRYAGTILLCTLLIGCRGSRDPKVINVEADDAAMNAAIEQARQTTPTFIAALQAPKPSQSQFAIKMEFRDGKNVEHMWLHQVTHDGKQFHGQLNNTPIKVRGVKLGDRRSVTPNKISDWMYVENRKLVGGYTVRVLAKQMSAKERAELPFDID